MCRIVIQGAFTQATPAESPGTSPLKRPPPLPPPPPPPHVTPLPLLPPPSPIYSLISLSRPNLQSCLKPLSHEHSGGSPGSQMGSFNTSVCLHMQPIAALLIFTNAEDCDEWQVEQIHHHPLVLWSHSSVGPSAPEALRCSVLAIVLYS